MIKIITVYVQYLINVFFDVKKKKVDGEWIYTLLFDDDRDGEFFKLLQKRVIPVDRPLEIDQYDEVLECRRNLESWLQSFGPATFFNALSKLRTHGLRQ